MSRYIDADKMIEDTKAMASYAEAITIDGIIDYINGHAFSPTPEISTEMTTENEPSDNKEERNRK